MRACLSSVWLGVTVALTAMVSADRVSREPASPSPASAAAASAKADAPPVVVDPARVTFTVSADDATVVNGIPLVDHYALEIFAVAGNTLVETVDLGKPTPDTDGTDNVQWASLLQAPLTTGVTYQAVVQAVGAGGTGNSAPSNPFTFNPPPCDPWISPTSMEFGETGGISATVVHAAPGCSWSVVSHESWMSVVSGKSGSGDGKVRFSVAQNPNRSNRNGLLTVAGSSFLVHQDGAEAKDNRHQKDKKNDVDKNQGKDKDKA